MKVARIYLSRTYTHSRPLVVIYFRPTVNEITLHCSTEDGMWACLKFGRPTLTSLPLKMRGKETDYAIQCIIVVYLFLPMLLCLQTDVEVAVFLSRKYPVGNLFEGPRLLPAIEVAGDTISRRVDSGEYANFTLKWIHSQTGCSWSVQAVMGAAARLYFENHVLAFFGPACSNGILGIGDFAASMNLPMFSGSAYIHELDNKDRYPTLTQTTYKSSTMVSFLKKLFELFGWNSYFLLGKGYGFTVTRSSIEDNLRDAGIRGFTLEVHNTEKDFKIPLKEASTIGRSEYV